MASVRVRLYCPTRTAGTRRYMMMMSDEPVRPLVGKSFTRAGATRSFGEAGVVPTSPTVVHGIAQATTTTTLPLLLLHHLN